MSSSINEINLRLLWLYDLFSSRILNLDSSGQDQLSSSFYEVLILLFLFEQLQITHIYSTFIHGFLIVLY